MKVQVAVPEGNEVPADLCVMYFPLPITCVVVELVTTSVPFFTPAVVCGETSNPNLVFPACVMLAVTVYVCPGT